MNPSLTKRVAIGIITLEGLTVAEHNLHDKERAEALPAHENFHLEETLISDRGRHNYEFRIDARPSEKRFPFKKRMHWPYHWV